MPRLRIIATRKKRWWYWKPRSPHAFPLGPIEAKNEKEARAGFRRIFKMKRVYGKVWEGLFRSPYQTGEKP